MSNIHARVLSAILLPICMTVVPMASAQPGSPHWSSELSGRGLDSYTNCVYFVRTMTSPERKLGITNGRVSRENSDPVLAPRAHADAHFVLAIRMNRTI